LAELNEFEQVWIRGVSKETWGIEFLCRCNLNCRKKTIIDEIKNWLSELEKVIPRNKICKYDIGSKVIIIKQTC
ncbi:MAG: hypothetical protein KKI14_01605, partial [Nanoarchaeota archaeon]|nr:hypothetical protein [Nanoarchaeota archaeon]